MSAFCEKNSMPRASLWSYLEDGLRIRVNYGINPTNVMNFMNFMNAMNVFLTRRINDGQGEVDSRLLQQDFVGLDGDGFLDPGRRAGIGRRVDVR